MVTAYGMGESLGLLTLSEIGDLSSSTKDEIIRECKTLIDKLYEDTKNILLSNKNLLEDITNALLEKETLYYEDMEKILH